jgi:ABC-type uncharacterized transport system permease subunit
MNSNTILIGLASVIISAGPIVFASIGETFTERAGIINLSLNGTIILTAMSAFAVAYATGSLLLGFLIGMLIGGLMALIIAFSSITLKQSQVAIGFILTLMNASLAYFLGNSFVGLNGPQIRPLDLPLLSQIPVIGELFFRADVLTYLSYIFIIFAWIWIYKTKSGLILQGLGERPAATFERGVNVHKLRYLYTIFGGLFVGLAGAVYSLSVKPGWMGTISGLDGFGWVALAITIFGGWNPLRAAFGCYLFSLLQWLGLVLQPSLPNIPSQVLQVAPFPIMILTLLFVNIGDTEWIKRVLAGLPGPTRRIASRVIRSLSAKPPAGIGIPFEQE